MKNFSLFVLFALSILLMSNCVPTPPKVGDVVVLANGRDLELNANDYSPDSKWYHGLPGNCTLKKDVEIEVIAEGSNHLLKVRQVRYVTVQVLKADQNGVAQLEDEEREATCSGWLVPKLIKPK